MSCGRCRWADGFARRRGDARSATPGAARHGAYSPPSLAGCGVAGAACSGPGSASQLWSPDGPESRSGRRASCPDVGFALPYPTICTSWRRAWTRLTVCFDYPPAICKVLSTTRAIASLNDLLRNTVKKRGAFPTDDAILKVLYLSLRRRTKNWTAPSPEWNGVLTQLTRILGDRVPTMN